MGRFYAIARWERLLAAKEAAREWENKSFTCLAGKDVDGNGEGEEAGGAGKSHKMKLNFRRWSKSCRFRANRKGWF